VPEILRYAYISKLNFLKICRIQPQTCLAKSDFDTDSGNFKGVPSPYAPLFFPMLGLCRGRTLYIEGNEIPK
jgi:hypothetical protein